jgi:hypothetical protein
VRLSSNIQNHVVFADLSGHAVSGEGLLPLDYCDHLLTVLFVSKAAGPGVVVDGLLSW